MDIGLISDQRENGVDPNWKIEFNRPDWKWWRWVGSPYWMIGATPNFTSDTGIRFTEFMKSDITIMTIYHTLPLTTP